MYLLWPHGIASSTIVGEAAFGVALVPSITEGVATVVSTPKVVAAAASTAEVVATAASTTEVVATAASTQTLPFLLQGQPLRYRSKNEYKYTY